MTNRTHNRFQWISDDVGCILLILIVSILGYGRFLFYSPIYDFYNFFFPYRYSVIDTIRHGIFPFWNPYQAMGIPAHADPQSGVFYLPVWLFSMIFGKYTTICCGAEYILHTFVGGGGFYFLSLHFVKDKFASLLTACFFLLSGLFVGNAQHLSWIVAATWFPWVIFSFIKLMEMPGIRPMLLFPIVFSLMLSGGYPGFIFVTAYILLALLVFYIVKYLKIKYCDWKRLLIYVAISGVITLCLCLPTLLSFWEIRSEMTRGAALSFSSTAEPLTLQSMISLCFPYIANSDAHFTHTDLSMGSIYMGLLALPAMAIGIWKNRDSLLWFVFGIGILSFITAFGTNIPLNRLAFEHLPFLNLIRLPGLYRLFFIVSMLLMSAKGIQILREDWPNHRTLTIYVCTLGAILFFLASFILYKRLSSFQFEDALNGPLSQKMMIESLISGITLIVFAITAHFANGKKALFILAIIMLAEPVVQANICGPKTIYDTRDLHTQLQKATSTEGFPIPDSLSSSQKMIHQHELYALWTNVGMFVKEVEWYSVSPVKLYRNQKMLQKYHEVDTELYLPMAFFPKNVVYDTLPHFLTADTAYTTQHDAVFACDSGKADITIHCFEPGHVVIHTQTDEPRPFALCQNVYNGWRATLDGVPVKIDTLNFAMQSVTVPAGNHEVVLEYKRPLITALFILQALLTLACLVLICFSTNFLSRFQSLRRG